MTRAVLAALLQPGDIVLADRAAGWDWDVQVVSCAEAWPATDAQGPCVAFRGVVSGAAQDGGARLVRVVVAADLKVKVAK